MSEVQLVEKTLKCGKESSEVFDALRDLVVDIRAGKKVAIIAAENLPGLMTAIDGYEQLGAEAKHESRTATLGYGVAQIGGAMDAPVEKAQ